MAEAAGLEALKSKDYVAKVVDYISEERGVAEQEIDIYGISCDSRAG